MWFVLYVWCMSFMLYTMIMWRIWGENLYQKYVRDMGVGVSNLSDIAPLFLHQQRLDHWPGNKK